MKTISKIAAIALVAVALVGVSTASAATVAELQAMIAQLTAQISALSGTPTTSSVTFTTNLTVGSKGAEVTALQNFLIGKGYNTLATGYFGPMTKAALAAYQTAKGITPAAGYFGPITMAAVNGESAVVTPGTGTTPTTGTGITTPGVEGTLSLTSSSAGTASSIYEGDVQAKIMGLKLEAKTSDISVQRIKLDLGNSSAIYNKVLSKIYVMDGSTVLSSSDLNSSTVVKDGGEYYITLTGMNALVKKDTSKVLTIAIDVRPSVDSTERSTSRIIQTVADSVRGVDGAGLDQYAGSAGAVSKTFTVSSTLVDSAKLTFSLSSASPKATTVIASSGSANNEADKVAGLIFNVKAEKDNVLINDLTVSATGTTLTQIPTVYLFDGSTELANASVNSTTGVATFSNLDLTISKDSTKSLTVKFDVRNATSTANPITISVLPVTSTLVDAENSAGDSLTSSYLSGSATGETMQVQTAGAVYTLVGTPTLTKSAYGGSTSATSSYLASFNFTVSAQGSALTVASSGAFVIGIYVNNARVATTSAIYEKPTSGVTGTGPYSIADGATATFRAETNFLAPDLTYTAGIATARLESATTNLGTVTYISDTFRTGSQTI